MYRLVEYACPGCGHQDEYLVDLDDRPRRIEISYKDEDGKTHRQDVTHKIDVGSGPGVFENDKDRGKERF